MLLFKHLTSVENPLTCDNQAQGLTLRDAPPDTPRVFSTSAIRKYSCSKKLMRYNLLDAGDLSVLGCLNPFDCAGSGEKRPPTYGRRVVE